MGSCASVTQHLGGNVGAHTHADCLAKCDAMRGCDGVSTNGNECWLKKGCAGDLSADPWALNDGSVDAGWSAYTLQRAHGEDLSFVWFRGQHGESLLWRALLGAPLFCRLQKA